MLICKISKLYVWHDIFLKHDRLTQIYQPDPLRIRSVIINIWRFVETDELCKNPHGYNFLPVVVLVVECNSGLITYHIVLFLPSWIVVVVVAILSLDEKGRMVINMGKRK